MPTMSNVHNIGYSETASAMGATISVAGPPRSLYLVIGYEPVEQLASRAGGQIVMRFTGEKLLAVLPYEGFLALNTDSRIFRIGPVNLDMQRLKSLSQQLAKTVAPPMNPV